MITLRLLTENDAEQFKSLRLVAIENSPTAIWPTREEQMVLTLEQIADRIRKTSIQAVFGAFDGEVLVGITGIRREPLQQVAHMATVWGVFVSPSHRGHGIAQKLLSAATAHVAEKWKCVQLMLWVNTENTPAKGLYASQGFQKIGMAPRALRVNGRFYDEEHMYKPLL